MPAAPRTLDLSPLRENCLFRSGERLDSHALVANELIDHSLSWGRGMVDASLFKSGLNRLRLYMLRYGAEVTVSPRPFPDFALVHMSVKGGAEIESDGVRLAVPEGRSAFINPRNHVRLRWIAGTEQLILKIPKALLEQARLDLALPAGAHVPGYLFPRNLSSQWGLLLQSLVGALTLPEEAALNSAWVDHFERNMALFLLGHHPSDVAVPTALGMGTTLSDLYVGETEGNREAERRMNAVLDLMQARLGAPISLYDLAKVAGVSERTLNALCHRFHGVSPMDLLRNMRLDAVRARLLLQPDASITQTALEYGFGHPGRFAAYYEDRFGELPHETLNQHKLPA